MYSKVATVFFKKTASVILLVSFIKSQSSTVGIEDYYFLRQGVITKANGRIFFFFLDMGSSQRQMSSRWAKILLSIQDSRLSSMKDTNASAV